MQKSAVEKIDAAMEAVRRGEQQIRMGQYQEAVEGLLPVREGFPRLPEVNMMLGRAYQAQGKRRAALQSYVQEIMVNPLARLAEIERAIDLLSKKFRIVEGHYEFPGAKAPKNWPEISAFLIIKNEEETLARCLESVKDLVSEIIILDTGSTDGSLKIAEKYGAQIHHFVWEDDFAAARNEALKYPSHEWILMMDADNWLLPEEANKIRWAVSSAKADIYLCEQTVREGRETPKGEPQIRLFRNHLGLRYTGVLHESLTASLLAAGRKAATTNIKIEHVLYNQTEERKIKKLERNLKALEKGLEKEPDNVAYQILQANSLYELKRLDDIEHTLEGILARVDDDYFPDIHLSQAYVELANEYIRTRRYAKLEQIYAQALADLPYFLWVWLVFSEKLLNGLGKAETVVHVLRRAAGMSSTREDRERLKTEDVADYLFQLQLRAFFFAGDIQAARKLLAAKGKKNSQAEINRKRLLAENYLKENRSGDALAVLTPIPYQDSAALGLLARLFAAQEKWEEAGLYQCMKLVWLDVPIPKQEWELLLKYEAKAGHPGTMALSAALGKIENDRDAAFVVSVGEAAVRRNDLDSAVEYFVKAHLLEPDDQGFTARLQETADTLGLDRLELQKNQGVRWVKQQAYDWARAALREVAAARPEDKQARQLVELLEKMG